MTDMTAEQAFEIIDAELRRDIPAGGSQVVRAWNVILKALTAPRVLEGWRLVHKWRREASSIDSPVGKSRDRYKEGLETAANDLEILLTAAPAPADVTLIDEGDIVQVSDSNEIATLLERVKVLEGLLAESKKVMKADNLHRGNPARRDLWQRITKALTVKSARLRGGSDE